MQEKGVVFFPERELIGTPKDYGISSYEDVFFPAEDGTRLHGWWVPAHDERAVLLWFHGNAGNISDRLDNLRKLHDSLGIPIFIFDYREYGRSEGYISRAGTFSDPRGAFHYIKEVRGISESAILYFGRSLGTALAVDLASRSSPLGLILEAAFTSSNDMMRLYFPYESPPASSTAKYDTLTLIDKISSPTLFIHGALDQAIPISMARKLFNRVQAPKFFYEVPGADHNDTFMVGGREYFDQWGRFLAFCLDYSQRQSF